MTPLVLSTVITCYQAYGILNRIGNVLGLSYQQRLEIISEVRKLIPSCPFTIKENEPPKK